MKTLLEIEIPLKPPSLNEWYSGKHWSNRKNAKDLWQVTIGNICKKQKIQPITQYPVIVETQAYFKSKRAMDSSNLITANKLAEDALKKAGIIVDDSPKYVLKNVANAPILGQKEDRTVLTIREITLDNL